MTMLPCLNKDALKLLVGTADERYNYSSEYFRKTHFPQVMHRYHGSQLLEEISENELYKNLLDVDSEGNRVFFLFGSTGSGKSELLCWIKDKWQQHEVNRPVVRISRTELNPQILIKKCYSEIGIPLGISIDETRWNLLIKKPITLINQIVWSTLSEILPSDEEIVPTALLIRPVIEKNVTEFIVQVQNGRIKKPLEVLHQVQFDELISSTTLQIPVEYSLLRKKLSQKLDQFLFEGKDIASLFKELTEKIKRLNIRPLLLIDDLVQSVNIYASDLLDQIITLEEGTWDVVIGLTPGAVRDTDKGFDLTQRIQNLDTITDRVKKLWLSDESGKDFYNLNRSQVVSYMSNYLVQLKASQGYNCGNQCPHYSECKGYSIPEKENDDEKIAQEINLLPFNRHLIRRTFDAIPVGKGKLRYMILNCKELLRFFQSGKKDKISRVLPLVEREKFSDHPELFIKTYAEWYVSEGKNECFIPQKILSYFGFPDGAMKVCLNTLESRGEINSVLLTKGVPLPNVVKSTVREWAEGKRVNPELLEPVRLGVSSLIHEVVKGVNMSLPFTPRMTATIQRRSVVNRTRYPITFDSKGIGVRSIFVNRGFAALQISNFQSLKHSEKTRAFQQIANEYETARWIYESEEIQRSWHWELESGLGMPIGSFVYLLKSWAETCIEVGNAHWSSEIQKQLPLTRDVVNLIEDSFKDWHLLRDNMIKIPKSSHKRELAIEFDIWLKRYQPIKVLEQYQIGEESLNIFFIRLKNNYLTYRDLLDKHLKQKIQFAKGMLPFLLGTGNKEYLVHADRINSFDVTTSYMLSDYLNYSEFEESLEQEEIVNKFSISTSLYNDVMNLSKQFESVCLVVEKQMGEFNKILNKDWSCDLPDWSMLSLEKEELTKTINSLSMLVHCLSISRNAWTEVLRSNHLIKDVKLVKTIWARLVEVAKQLVRRSTVNIDVQNLINEWQCIDFYELKTRLEVMDIREAGQQSVIKHLKNDLGYKSINNLDDLIIKIELNEDLRPSVKRHLKLLLEQGFTTLPPMQWKRLLDELKMRFPTLFEVVEIRLVASRI
ncbi:P-loop NTPase fold protein [Paenibacillus sp. ClWae2A]|uniref:P-loop NTPase fold protein n=1 Tax=Paenibacillus sp. ClWae2A TaxID=3057177 RepID=UPI0028F543DE|nr:P-loop NTPase fold protein [Paenibacillus sp. ClWae2A]MDT9722276.1 P-loop NTPase fold protein [Paenibacillus sp. ClWae2A]